MKLYDFNMKNDWPFEPVVDARNKTKRDKRKKNTELFLKWLLKLLQTTAPRELKDDELYNTQGVYIHPTHNEHLSKHICPWNFLNYSPVCDKNIPLDKIGIESWFEKRLSLE